MRKRRGPSQSVGWFVNRLREYTAAVRDAYAASGNPKVSADEFQRRANRVMRMQDELNEFVREAMYVVPAGSQFPFLRAPGAAPKGGGR